MNYPHSERAQPPFYIMRYWMPCPSDDSIEVTCYLVTDANGMVYLGGIPFTFAGHMLYPDRFHFPDWRDLLLMRGSVEWTIANDFKPEYFEEYMRPDYRRRAMDAIIERLHSPARARAREAAK